LVEQGRLTSFRTYMTGEIFGLLRKSGTLSQLMADDAMDDGAFDKGVMQSQRADASNLLHSLFSVRTLGLFDRLPRESLASYMSGLLVGAEVRDATAWLSRLGISAAMTAIGSPLLLRTYERAAKLLHLDIACRDSAGLLPVALLSLAQEAGLLSSS
jgi:2-dehydro-3-deoxygalactonokinase